MSNDDPMKSYHNGLMGANDGSIMGMHGELDRKMQERLTGGGKAMSEDA